MSTKTVIYRYASLLFIVGGLFFAVFASTTSVLAIDYPCGTYGSGDYTSSPECQETTATPSTSGTSSSPALSPNSSIKSTSSPNPDVPSSTITPTHSTAPSPGNNAQNVATANTQANTQKDSWKIVLYIVGGIVVVVALVIGLVIRRGKVKNP